VAALIWKRATKQGAVASICSGAIVTLLWSEVEVVRASLPAAFAGLDAVLPAIAISVSMLVGVSLLTRPVEGKTKINEQRTKEPTND
jgi:Na+/proline symporter